MAARGNERTVQARAVLALLAVALVAGCGGSKSSASKTTTAGSTPTQAQFAHHGNAICSAYYRRLNALGPPPTTPAELVAYIRRSLHPTRIELDRLAQLQAPARDRRGLATYVALGRREVARAVAVVAAARTQDLAKVQAALARLAAIDAQGNAVAKSIGLRVCGRSTSTK